jgi:hypothetical protein
MSIEELEINWRVGAHRYSLVLTPDGRPHLTGPAGAVEALGNSAGATAAGPPDAPAAAPPRPGPERRGKAWSELEEAHVCDGFARGDTPGAIAAALGRTSGAVRARLVRFGLLTEEEAGLRYPVPRSEAADSAAPSAAEA